MLITVECASETTPGHHLISAGCMYDGVQLETVTPKDISQRQSGEDLCDLGPESDRGVQNGAGGYHWKVHPGQSGDILLQLWGPSHT